MVKKFRPKSPNKSKAIPIDVWSRYLSEMFRSEQIGNQNTPLNYMFTDVLREDMDSEFCMGELEKGISKLNNKKSRPRQYLK